MATSKKTVMRRSSDLRVAFYVRTQLNEDRVLKIAGLYQSGVDIPPIEITPNNEIVDGRHRWEAQKLIDREEIECRLIEPHDTVGLLAHALTANEGGALPPNSGDYVHTLFLMLKAGASERHIINLLQGTCPKPLLRGYLNQASAKLAHQKMKLARQAVTDGMTVTQAATKFDVKLESLRAAIAGKKQKTETGMQAIRAGLRNRYFSTNRYLASQMRRVIMAVQDGDIQPEEAEDFLRYNERFLKQAVLRTQDFQRRLESAKRGTLQTWDDDDEEGEGEFPSLSDNSRAKGVSAA